MSLSLCPRWRNKMHYLFILNINNFSNKIVDVIRKFHEFSLKIARVITIVVSNPVNFLVNGRLYMTSEPCQRILDDVTICRHLAVESTFLYFIHSGGR